MRSFAFISIVSCVVTVPVVLAPFGCGAIELGRNDADAGNSNGKGTGSGTTPGPTSTPSSTPSAPPSVSTYATCTTQTDCAWSEIDREILSPSDCPCLFGCPGIPLNKETAERRQKQYTTNCDPNHDGNGRECGVDDCADPGPIACNDGICGSAKVVDASTD